MSTLTFIHSITDVNRSVCGDRFESDIHSCFGSDWRIVVFPAGTHENQNCTVVLLLQAGSQLKVKCDLMLKHANGRQRIMSKEAITFDNNSYEYHFRLFQSRRARIVCKITVVNENFTLQSIVSQAHFFDVGAPDYSFSFVVNDVIFRVNKHVLSCNSSVFKAMLESEWQEAVSSQIVIDDFSVGAVSQFLYLLCGETYNQLSDCEICDIIRLADKYDVKSVMKSLFGHIQVHNCLQLLLFVEEIQCDVMKKGILDFITTNADKLFTLYKGQMGELLGEPLMDQVMENVVEPDVDEDVLAPGSFSIFS